jgi:hypothetical protein
MWSSRFSNVKTGFGHRGIIIRGLSVNNVITGCSLNGSNSAGSRGIVFGDGTSTEGLNIDKCLFFQYEIAIYGPGAAHVYVTNNIIDFNLVYGIFITDSGTNVSDGWTIEGNYIAMSGVAGSAGIQTAKSYTGSNPRGNRISGNDILVYSGASCLYGVQVTGTEAKYNTITGNTIKGFGNNDIFSERGEIIISNNQCLSTLTHNIYSSNGGIITDNVGVVYYTVYTTKSTLGKMLRTYAEAAPTSGSWNRGDIVYDTTPDASGYIGWICVTAGTPGTWKTFGAITA